ncbi:MAG TPA: hypothetical protein VHF01_11775 [Candidatus Acidoferrum sp.]|nr:hypothetical protein [Candidatus Acidoferrum sp.]
MESSGDRHTIVAIVRQVDTDTLQPATARVQFHFDANGKMTSYDLQRTPDVPWQP